MPYSKPSDVPDAVPKDKKAQFMEVWNSAYKKAKDDGKSDDAAEKSAFAQAWGVIGKEKNALELLNEVLVDTVTPEYQRRKLREALEELRRRYSEPTLLAAAIRYQIRDGHKNG
jgi:cation transport regulator ChaB